MSKQDRFKGIDWEDVLRRLTVRARQLFVAACLKNHSAALLQTAITPDDLARQVVMEALRDEKVKFRPGRASAVTFLSHVLENDFKDLLRKGLHRERCMRVLDPCGKGQEDDPQYSGVISDVGDAGAAARHVETRAMLLELVKGEPQLEEYIAAVVDCGARKPADQATLLGVSSAEITNRRKRLFRLAAAKAAKVKRDVDE